MDVIVKLWTYSMAKLFIRVGSIMQLSFSRHMNTHVKYVENLLHKYLSATTWKDHWKKSSSSYRHRSLEPDEGRRTAHTVSIRLQLKGAGAVRVQVGRLGVPMSINRTSLGNSTSRLMSRIVSISAPLRHHRMLSNAPIFQPSAIQLFRSPLPDRGHGRRTSRRQLSLGNVWKPISSIVPSRNSQ